MYWPKLKLADPGVCLSGISVIDQFPLLTFNTEFESPCALILCKGWQVVIVVNLFLSLDKGCPMISKNVTHRRKVWAVRLYFSVQMHTQPQYPDIRDCLCRYSSDFERLGRLLFV